jgi:hypothetical protein
MGILTLELTKLTSNLHEINMFFTKNKKVAIIIVGLEIYAIEK